MLLKDLAQFEDIAIQCHDNPDADALASAFALCEYFKGAGCNTRVFYGGYNRITKPNLTAFVRGLGIPAEFFGKSVERVEELFLEGARPLLLTVDCQYGAGNVTMIGSENIAVIDHHIMEKDLAQYTLIRPYLGSCATVVWQLLSEAGYDWSERPVVSTALYYGLYTDTNSLSEIAHPLDKDMLESLRYDAAFIKKLKGSNLTRDELLIAGEALHTADYIDHIGAALYEAQPCDPNILGFISDLTLQVEGIDVCVGFCEINGGVKLSLRSSTGEVMAHELADFLTKELGSGGGNRDKAGGFFRLRDEESARRFLKEKIKEYFASYDKIVAGDYPADLNAFKKYRKKKLMVGYVQLQDAFAPGTHVAIRTLEGDADFPVSEDTYVMVGMMGETYPIAREKFERNYARLDGPFAFDPNFIGEDFYAPTARDKLYGRRLDLTPYIRPCMPQGDSFIYARPVDKETKVFTKWYSEGYMLGKKGDYLALRSDDLQDVYIVDAKIFGLTYEEV